MVGRLGGSPEAQAPGRLGEKCIGQEEAKLQQCEQRLADCARVRRRCLDTCQAAERGMTEAEVAVESAERLVSSLEAQEKKCQAEAPCVVGVSMRQNWEAKCRLLEAKKEVSAANLSAARERLVAERQNVSLARQRLKTETAAASTAVEAVSKQRTRTKEAPALAVGSGCFAAASGAPSSLSARSASNSGHPSSRASSAGGITSASTAAPSSSRLRQRQGSGGCAGGGSSVLGGTNVATGGGRESSGARSGLAHTAGGRGRPGLERPGTSSPGRRVGHTLASSSTRIGGGSALGASLPTAGGRPLISSPARSRHAGGNTGGVGGTSSAGMTPGSAERAERFRGSSPSPTRTLASPSAIPGSARASPARNPRECTRVARSTSPTRRPLGGPSRGVARVPTAQVRVGSQRGQGQQVLASSSSSAWPIDTTESELREALEAIQTAEALKAKLAALPERLRRPLAQRCGGLRDLLTAQKASSSHPQASESAHTARAVAGAAVVVAVGGAAAGCAGVGAAQ